MITAPFNFVPLNEKVFFPSWADDVSHDIPFEDGESGEIDITITAKSPIFIRDHENPEQFCQYDGQYYIPGSSVKGMLRNVLEIMSFGKLDVNSYDDNIYAVRDLSNAQNFYMKQMNLIDEPFTRCGWLKKIGNQCFIEDCGTPGRIHHNQIDRALNIKFASKFNKDGFEKTSEYKYNLVGNKIHTISVSEMYKSEANPKYDKREFYKFEKNGKNSASLILTGQPTPRKNTGKMGDGKGFEFLFFNSTDELQIDEKVFENFKFAYFDDKTTEPKESPDWKYWKKKLYSGEKIPVFFQKEGKKVLHFGLSYLYKLPYKYSTKDGIEKEHFDTKVDLAQTIFGYINKEQKEALKGRVQFSHFKAIQNIQPLTERKEILGTPRASYYPMYIKQHNTEFKTYMDGDFSIAGRKMYPIHKGKGVIKTEDTGNDNVGTTFTPLSNGVIFQGKLRYHNLKKVEIGAILSALTFHNTPNTYHNIGMAKSLGYGKIDLKVNGVDNLDEYLKKFETYITNEIEDWVESIQLKELLAMAIEQDNSGNSKLKYMKLEDFAKQKSKTKDYLKCYSELQNIKTVQVKTLINQEELEQHRQKQAIIKQEQEQRLKHKNDWQKAKASNTIQALEYFISNYSDSKYINEAKNIIDKIRTQETKAKEQEAQKEANEKWEAIQMVDKKFKQKALDDFIKNYPDSTFINQANTQLAQLFKSSSNNSNSSLDELSKVNDSKKFKFILEANEKELENNKEIIKENAIRIYNSLNGKKLKNFFKDIQLGRFLGSDVESEVKKEVGAK